MVTPPKRSRAKIVAGPWNCASRCCGARRAAVRSDRGFETRGSIAPRSSKRREWRMPSVRLDMVRKQFGDAVAVNDISVEFRDGEMTSVLGPSGCGKTTTLNLIAGFFEP